MREPTDVYAGLLGADQDEPVGEALVPLGPCECLDHARHVPDG
jgi:hypothetical protein